MTLSFRLPPFSLVSCRKHPWGFSLQRFPLSRSLLRLSARPALSALPPAAPRDPPTTSPRCRAFAVDRLACRQDGALRITTAVSFLRAPRPPLARRSLPPLSRPRGRPFSLTPFRWPAVQDRFASTESVAPDRCYPVPVARSSLGLSPLRGVPPACLGGDVTPRPLPDTSTPFLASPKRDLSVREPVGALRLITPPPPFMGFGTSPVRAVAVLPPMPSPTDDLLFGALGSSRLVSLRSARASRGGPPASSLRLRSLAHLALLHRVPKATVS